MISLLLFFVKRERSHSLFVLFLPWNKAYYRCASDRHHHRMVDTQRNKVKNLKHPARQIWILENHGHTLQNWDSQGRPSKLHFSTLTLPPTDFQKSCLHSVVCFLHAGGLGYSSEQLQSHCRQSIYTKAVLGRAAPLSSLTLLSVELQCYPSPAELHHRSDPEFTSFSIFPPQQSLVITFPSQHPVLIPSLWRRG